MWKRGGLPGKALCNVAVRPARPSMVRPGPRIVPMPRSALATSEARRTCDFTRAHELIERTAQSTRRWRESGGLARQRIPGALRPHVDEAPAADSCDPSAQAAVPHS
jgi:hypothetical protein